MIENPYFLLLFLGFLLYFCFWKSKKFYFRHPCVDNLSTFNPRLWLSWELLMLAGAAFLVIGAANFVWKTKESFKVSLVHKYVLINDGSGSMVDNQKLNGIGKELTSLMSGNAKLFDFLGKRNDGSRDLVGAVVFSDDSFVVSYLSDDPEFVHKKLKRIDYRLFPMNQGTNVAAGLWTGLEMVLSHDQTIGLDKLESLQLKFYGQGHNIKHDNITESIVANKARFAGSSLIFFTDGFFFAPDGNNNIMSTYKIINFCRDMGIRVYFISIFQLDQFIVQYCKDSNGRGEVITDGYNKQKLEAIYEEIVTSQAKEYMVKEEDVDRSLGTILGFIGLALIFCGLILHNTKQLNFTEV